MITAPMAMVLRRPSFSPIIAVVTAPRKQPTARVSVWRATEGCLGSRLTFEDGHDQADHRRVWIVEGVVEGRLVDQTAEQAIVAVDLSVTLRACDRLEEGTCYPISRKPEQVKVRTAAERALPSRTAMLSAGCIVIN